MNASTEQQLAAEIESIRDDNSSEKCVDDEHICCECGCGVVLQEYRMIVDGKKYCRVCGDDHVFVNTKTPCYECNAICSAGELKIGDFKQLMYCESCWNERFDNCYKCGHLVVIEQESPPYEYDEDSRLQCVCDYCQHDPLDTQRNKLLEFCRAEGIDERLVKSLAEIRR